MTETPRAARIVLLLTPGQKEQIRQATGREVSRLELRLPGLPEPTGPPAGEKEHVSKEPLSRPLSHGERGD